MAKAEIIGRGSTASGRSSLKVRCTCGKISYFAIWSWAGNGCIRCRYCKMKVDYRTLEVEERSFYRKPRRRKVYWWQCQDCGEIYPKFSDGEPRRGCPTCGQRGVKTFVKEEKGGKI